jgi:hypothetical protein
MTAKEARELSVSNMKGNSSLQIILDEIKKAASNGELFIVAIIPDTPEYAQLISLGYVISEHWPNGKRKEYTFKISW